MEIERESGSERARETQGTLRPMRALGKWMRISEWAPHPNDCSFSDDIKMSIAAIAKITAAGNHTNDDRIVAHSICSGGAIAMFVAG